MLTCILNHNMHVEEKSHVKEKSHVNIRPLNVLDAPTRKHKEIRQSKDGNPWIGGRGDHEAHARPTDGRNACCDSGPGGRHGWIAKRMY
jgi:hypothetical protein